MVKFNNFFFINLILLISCTEKSTNNKLIGNWESEESPYGKISLKVNKDSIFRFENRNQIIYDKYEIKKDTLILFQKNIKEVHLFVIDNDYLKFKTIHPYDEDIQLFDIVRFRKKSH